MGADDGHRPQLVAAGFDVRVPALSRRKPSPSLRVFVDAAPESTVGANQLANVRWSAVFDGVELTAADIARLAKEARPLIRSGERWVAIDRPTSTRRPKRWPSAPTPPSSPAPRCCGSRSASKVRRCAAASTWSAAGGPPICSRPRPTSRRRRPAFPTASSASSGATSREALAWLGFLDKAGLGGCLALDMGLGKTPTMLAHLLAGAGTGPALVIAPPAVVGNWTAEAARFTPDLRVVVHHGARRAAADEIAAEVADADVVVTTYGTAVRDVEALAGRVVGARRARRSAGDQEPRQRHVAAAAPHLRRAAGSRSPVRRSRTGSATSGRSSTSPTPVSSVRARSSSRACRTTAPRPVSRPKTRCTRSTASSCSAAPRPSR